MDEVGQPVGGVRAQVPHVGNEVVGVHHHRGDRGGAAERWLTGQHGVQDAAERVQVGAAVDPATQSLLGSEVLGGAHDRVRRREGLGAGGLGELGDPEVQHANTAVGGVGDVAGLDVAVHESPGVGGLQRCGDLAPDLDDLVDGHGASGDALGQARPGQQLHDEVGGVVLHPAVVDRHDSLVAQARGCPRLAFEAGRPGLVGNGAQVDELDRDLAAQHRVGAAPHLAHSAATDPLLEDVPARETTLLVAHHPNLVALP